MYVESIILSGITIEVPDEANMHTHVSMHARTVETDVNAEGDTGPSWISCIAVKTRLFFTFVRILLYFLKASRYLIRFLGLKYFEDLLCFLFCWFCHERVVVVGQGLLFDVVASGIIGR